MSNNIARESDLLRITIPGPIKVDILGVETMEFSGPELRLSGVDSLTPDQMSILQVMTKLISQLDSQQD